MKFPKSCLDMMIKQCHTEEDIEITVNAYYNFLGHFSSFKNTTVDSMMQKAIDLNCYKLLHGVQDYIYYYQFFINNLFLQIVENHNYLMYFPDPKIMTQIQAHYTANNLIEESKDFFKSIRDKRLLKVEPAVYDDLIQILHQNNEYKIINKVT